MKNKLSILAIVLILIFNICGCTNKEKDKAIKDFNQSVTTAKENNKEINTSISNLQKLINSKTPPLDETTLENAKNAINEGKKEIVKIPKLPSKIEEIKADTKKLSSKADCSKTLTQLKNANTSLSSSIKQMKQITNPDEAFILERLKGVKNITNAEAVTEENDVNGLLHKQGGYTSCIYFSCDLINQAELSGNSIIEKGTEAGGCIEVFKSTEDANKRNEYLSTFDGSFLSSGSHSVVGTIVIRISDKLTATNQKEMETNIYNSFIALK